VSLAGKEFALLHALIADPTRVYTREELLRDVWGLNQHARTRTLDSHAFRLRTKLVAAEPGRPWVINVWGIGYRLCNSEVRR
jgi:DNA-binding response OmpR family regulator